MPSQQDIQNAATRRAARKAQREANVEAAHDQERAVTDGVKEAQAAAQKPKSQRAPEPHRFKVAKERAAAERMADDQERAMQPAPVETEAFYGSRGNPPLHVLNQIAREGAKPLRQHAREVANAAGKAAFDATIGKRDANIGTMQRERRMRDAQDALDRQKERREPDA